MGAVRDGYKPVGSFEIPPNRDALGDGIRAKGHSSHPHGGSWRAERKPEKKGEDTEVEPSREMSSSDEKAETENSEEDGSEKGKTEDAENSENASSGARGGVLEDVWDDLMYQLIAFK